MRAIIIAALLATAALAHEECNARSCNGLNRIGKCVGRMENFIATCPSGGQRNVDGDARMPVDLGCMNFKPAFAEVRDTNGTLSASVEIYSWGGGGYSSGLLAQNCTVYPVCSKVNADNVTYHAATFTDASSGSAYYADRDGIPRWISSFSVETTVSVFRQAAKFYYGADQSLSHSVTRGSIVMNIGINANRWIGPNDDMYVLFRISNNGGNPFEMSVGAGERKVANGITFFEKAVNATGMYSDVASAPTEWFTPALDLAERFELNYVTYKYEKSQFLRFKLPNAYSQARLLATF